jgi:hypothetical protein
MEITSATHQVGRVTSTLLARQCLWFPCSYPIFKNTFFQLLTCPTLLPVYTVSWDGPMRQMSKDPVLPKLCYLQQPPWSPAPYRTSPEGFPQEHVACLLWAGLFPLSSKVIYTLSIWLSVFFLVVNAQKLYWEFIIWHGFR